MFLEYFVRDTSAIAIGFAWLAYAIVFIVTLYKSFEFFKALEDKSEFEDVPSVPQLKNLYLSSFILQAIAIVLTFFILMFLPSRMKK